jgi:hypothetical protein
MVLLYAITNITRKVKLRRVTVNSYLIKRIIYEDTSINVREYIIWHEIVYNICDIMLSDK